MTPWWVTLLAAVIPAALSCVVTLFISRKSQINKNSDSIKSLSKSVSKLKDSQKKYCESISDEIGRTINDKTLTAQHADLQNMLQKEIDVAERRYMEEEKRIRNFTVEQHNMAEAIEDFKLFIESWQRLTSDVNNLNSQINRLEQENEELREKNKELNRTIQPYNRNQRDI
ncbi:hypothetical protein [Ruminococcus sp.]|uniref:hypothetical protein n=1 Tax=Ruminococcus sp. TaxID=41978 RepID=UPI0025CF8AB1|nr:hypothetical protein [Ruminococcus sp.]